MAEVWEGKMKGVLFAEHYLSSHLPGGLATGSRSGPYPCVPPSGMSLSLSGADVHHCSTESVRVKKWPMRAA